MKIIFRPKCIKSSLMEIMALLLLSKINGAISSMHSYCIIIKIQ